MKASLIFAGALVLLATRAHAIDRDMPPSKWADAQSIVDEIKKQNPPDNVKLKIRLGVLQTITNNSNATLPNGQTDGVNLGYGGDTFGFGLDGDLNLFGNFGLEARETYSQNFIPGDGSRNGTDVYLSWFDAGPRYTFYVDSTHLDNNVVVKVLYHENYNNALLNAGAETYMWVNYYSGVSASFERNIPITNKLGITGMFDLLQIFNTSSPTLNFSQGATPTKNVIAKSGYGFEIHAEVYYKMLVSGRPVRLGLMYWQQGNQSEVDDSIKQNLGRESYFQVTRALFGTMSVLF